MALGRFREAVADVAETIRRAFSAPACRSIPPAFLPPEAAGLRLLEAACAPADFRFEPTINGQDLQFQPAVKEDPMSFEARLRGETAWAAWAGGAKLCEMPVFRVETCGRLSIPALPRAVPARRQDPPRFRTSALSLRDPLAAPPVRGLSLRICPAKARRDLAVVLGLPIAISGEDFHRLPRGLNMRYTFQLVKATGENIRNLEVLGVFDVPVKGVVSLRHDPRTGRLLVNLGPEAVGAERGRFILARKKDDHGFVSCFVEA